MGHDPVGPLVPSQHRRGTNHATATRLTCRLNDGKSFFSPTWERYIQSVPREGKRMKALQVTRNGRPGDVLAVADVEVPEPGAGEVRIRVAAASLNFNDIDRCLGKLVSVPTPPPYTLGMDACGIVDAAGAGCQHWLGKRVVAITKMALGGIAEFALADGVSLFDAPLELDDAESAAFLLPYQASHLALFRRGRLQAGQTLVVHSAASGLGTAGI
jgi:NADPH2:quinone reductase